MMEWNKNLQNFYYFLLSEIIFFYFLFLQEKPFFIVKLSSFFEKKDIDQFNIKITEKHNHVAIIELHNSVLIKYKSADWILCGTQQINPNFHFNVRFHKTLKKLNLHFIYQLTLHNGFRILIPWVKHF